MLSRVVLFEIKVVYSDLRIYYHMHQCYNLQK